MSQLGPKTRQPDWRHAYQVTSDKYYRQLKKDAANGQRIRVKYDEDGFPFPDPQGEAVPVAALDDDDHRAIARAMMRGCLESGIQRHERNQPHVQR